MLNIRTVLLFAVVLLVLGLAARFVTAGTGVVFNPSSDPVNMLENQERSATQNRVDYTHSYRSPLDECYDVGLREVAKCRNASRPPVPSYRSPLDECYDVSLREAASCRNADQASAP